MQCKSRWTLVVYFKWNKELVEENLLVNTNNIHYMSWNKTHGHVLSFCNTFCTYIYIYLKLTRYNYIKLVFVTSLFKWLKYCAYLMPPSLIYTYLCWKNQLKISWWPWLRSEVTERSYSLNDVKTAWPITTSVCKTQKYCVCITMRSLSFETAPLPHVLVTHIVLDFCATPIVDPRRRQVWWLAGGILWSYRLVSFI